MNQIVTIENKDVESLAQEAYQTFVKNNKLKFYSNIARSSYGELLGRTFCKDPKKAESTIFMISRHTLNECLSDVQQPVNPSTCSFYFTSSKGNKCYINHAVVVRFTEIAKQAFPQSAFFKREGVVDQKTGTQLLPITKHGIQKFATINPEVTIVLKTTAWVAKLVEDSMAP